ncbi:MAG TPA: hypothetical protein VFS64_09200 [Solirubrobacterales bacterium]|nr:hypothetical protein [Solirubrobacterales bacterium]
MGKQSVVDWERRRALPVALATLAAVALLIVSNAVAPSSGEGAAEALRSVEEHKGSMTLSGVMQAIGFLLLMAPLFYLFRATRARNPQVRPQMVGLIVAGSLFLAVSAALTIGARTDAADQFVGGEAKSTLSAAEAKEKCQSDRKGEGAKEFAEEFEPATGETPLAACEKQKSEDDEAENALGEASLAPLVSGLGLAGALAFVVSFFYTGLWAMRTGLLTRFWGSLGMVVGITFLLGPLFLLALVWLVYFAFLLFGVVPGGKPPAWEAGEAVPWPTPGERAAAELEPGEGTEESAGGAAAGTPPDAERRKRKQRE